MAANNFYLDYNVTGAERKRLVQAISAYTGADAEYLGAPTFSYRVDYFTIDRSGVVSFDSCADSGEIEGLIEALVNEGFVSQGSNMECEEEEGTGQNPEIGLTVQMPLEKVAAENLTKLLEAKGSLIKKALGIDALPIEIGENRVSFPWFKKLPEPDAVQAYTHFIAALCEMSRNQKRVTATEREVENEKYAFRCFLLRLGFIGAEYKTERKILLKNLSGSSAFKSGQKGGAGDEISE